MSDEPRSDATPTTGANGSHAPWRVHADLREVGDQPFDALRLLVVADVLRRQVEDLWGTGFLLAVLEDSAGLPQAVAHAGQALRIRGPRIRTPSLVEDNTSLGGPPRLVLAPEESGRVTGDAARHEPILRLAATNPSSSRKSMELSRLLDEHDPLALRLALLRFEYSTPPVLSQARLHRADETLQRWRYKVADWAEMPPAPMVGDSVETTREALVDGLGIGAVLKLLHRVEVDLRLASGSKFATFTYLDQALGLDLGYLIGKVRR